MISVCIATYNASKYLRCQVVSILAQLSDSDELIISDDLSGDDTLEIISKINDPRIKIISNHVRLGVVKNFERALYAAKGDLIFLADQDDVWLPNKVDICKKALANHLLVVSDCEIVDANLNLIEKSWFAEKKSKKGIFKNFYKNSYIGCCMAFRKELLEFALPFPANIPMHDIWLGMLAEIKGHVVFLPSQLVLYRRHGENTSSLKSDNNIFKKLRFRILLLLNLVARLLASLWYNKYKAIKDV